MFSYTLPNIQIAISFQWKMIKTKFKKLVIAKLFGITKIYNRFYIKKSKKW